VSGCFPQSEADRGVCSITALSLSHRFSDYFAASVPITFSSSHRRFFSPFIFNVADLWPDVIVDQGFLKEGFVMKILRFIERWSYRRAAYVNTVTDWIVKVLKEKKSVPADKILFLPNGADTETFRPRPPDQALLSRLGLAGKQVALWAGTLGFAHGIDNILSSTFQFTKERARPKCSRCLLLQSRLSSSAAAKVHVL
jgi:glycosyltransferase involved in cell wall biosynthesis